MSKAYSLDLRERVVDTVEAGASRHETAERFEVSVSSAIRWVQRRVKWRHHALERAIVEALAHRSTADSMIAELKREKPHLKEQIERLRQDQRL